jgi:hypothetical protein
MPSDKARTTYDGAQQYQSVVMQEGRVLLDADWNEAQQIALEETRAEARDFVGPAGTPDNGYAIALGNLTARNLSIGPGTMYVGGIRSVLAPGSTYLTQREWIAPDAIDKSAGVTAELVYLELTEDEVSAVEDTALREPALGGPDTAGRLRINQRIRRLPVTTSTCKSAFDALRDSWNARGYDFDPGTMELRSRATLKVSFRSSGRPANACDPVGGEGYLWPENQMIRVRLIKADTLVWGFDNASFLYRVTAREGDALTLASRPVDDAHRPRRGQAIELLRGTTRLANGSIIAEPFGPVFVLDEDYLPDSNAVPFFAPLPAAYDPGTGGNVIFLRVWESVSMFELANPVVALGDTGLEVTINSSATSSARQIPGTFDTRFTGSPQVFNPITVWREGISTTGGTSPVGRPIYAPWTVFDETAKYAGDFWTFAARPGTPTEVYPKRYFTPQPPEGVRRWLCSLAVVDWPSGRVHDCRERFDDLVTLSRRCCTINLTPRHLEQRTLQAILDGLTGHASVRVCLAPGTYALPAPLVLDSRHKAYTIEGCGEGVVLAPSDPADGAFSLGLIHILDTSQITLLNLQIESPCVARFLSIAQSAGSGSTTATDKEAPPAAIQAEGRVADEIAADAGAPEPVSIISKVVFGGGGSSNRPLAYHTICIRAVSVSQLEIERCRFVFPAPRDKALDAPFLGAAVAAHGTNHGVTFRNNRVVVDGKLLVSALSGLVFVPSLSLVGASPTFVHTVATDVLIENNEFVGLAHAVLAWADLGRIRLFQNIVTDCLHGFVLGAMRWFGAVARLQGAAEVILPPMFQFDPRPPDQPTDPGKEPPPNTLVATAGLPADASAASPTGTEGRPINIPPFPQVVVAAFGLFHPTIALPTRLWATMPSPLRRDLLAIGSGQINLRDTLIDDIHTHAGTIADIPRVLGGDFYKSYADAWTAAKPLGDIELSPFGSLSFSQMYELGPTQKAEIECAHNRVARSAVGVASVNPKTGVMTWSSGSSHDDGMALFILIDSRVESRVLVTANAFVTGMTLLPTALILFPRRCTVTGNTIENQTPPMIILTPGVTPGKTETTPGKTETAPGKTETTPGKTETAPGKTETAPGTTTGTIGKAASSEKSWTDQPLPSISRKSFVPSLVLFVERDSNEQLGAAITGNAFLGWPYLPVRHPQGSDAPPPVTWYDLNSIVE